jgi:tetratricopeptide (TPR) repeat protein
VRDAEFFGLDLRRRVQLELFKNEPRSRDELVRAIGESVPDVSAALALLAAEGRVLCAGERYVLSADVVQFVNVAREFTTSDDAATFLSSAYTQFGLAQAELIRYVDDRYRLGMEATERDAVVGLMRISSSALRHVLFSDPARSLRTHAHIHEIVATPEEKAHWLAVHRQSLLQEALFRAVHDLTHEATNLSAHLGALGVKRFRIATKLVAVGDPWKPLRVESEHNIAIAKAGAAIEAGALITYSDPAEFHLWNGILNLHAEEFAYATSDFTAALEAAVKADDAAKTNAALNNLALVLMRQKNWVGALRVLAKMAAVGIETYTPYTNVIICLMELGRHQEANEYVVKTVARFPEAENSEVIKRFRNGWPGSAA